MLRGDSGKFALEATLVLPLVLIITFACLFITSGAARQAGLYADAAAAGARAAFNWDNSHKAAATGAFYPGRHDDLYWRLTQDFAGSGLVQRKIAKAVNGFSGRGDIRGAYSNRWLLRKVTVDADAEQSVPGFIAAIYAGGPLQAEVETVVAEPAETVRQIDWVRTYWPVIREMFSEQETDEMVEQFRRRPDLADPAPLSFATHDEARAYMQKMVHGRLSRMDTETVGEWRMIDALDRHHVAHQAYFGFKDVTSDIMPQLLKDEELLQRGKLKGVVWHFFRRDRDGAIGLSDDLRRQLEERGIVVIVHE